VTKSWITRGFEAFREGTFGNAGQNLYVSRQGVLQRIHLFDLNRDGYADLVFCNAQDHWERPPAYVYHDAMGDCRRRELPAEGAITGCVADLDGDGYDDLVLGMQNNGISLELNATIYFGSPGGLTEQYQAQVPAPRCRSAAAGDFNADGRVDLALVSGSQLRLFYRNELGFEPWRYVTLDVSARQIAAGDLDGDGHADLYVLMQSGRPRVYWGGPDGLRTDRYSEVPHDVAWNADGGGEVSVEEQRTGVEPLACIVRMQGVDHVFVPQADKALLVAVGRDRRFGPPRSFPCRNPVAAASGRITGPDATDVVVAGIAPPADGVGCRVFRDGRSEDPIDLPCLAACDLVVADFDGDGRDEIAVCRHWEGETYSVPSVIFGLGDGGTMARRVEVASEGARRVLVMRSADDPLPQLAFVNQCSRNAVGRVSPVIYWNGPDGFSPSRCTRMTGIGAVNSIACDINDDGHPDLVVANCAENAMHLDPGSFVFLGGNAGFRPDPDMKLPTRSAMGLAVGDINRDGYLDVILSSFSANQAVIFFGREGGFDTERPQRLEFPMEGDEYLDGRRMLLADLNNDGWLDLVVTFCRADRTFILWGGPKGFDVDNRQVLSLVRPSTPMAADLTGNGYLDLIFACHKRSETGPHDSFVYVYWNSSQGLRESRRTLLPANAVLGMALADFNRDGVLDLFVANYSNGRERDVDSYFYWGAAPASGEPFFSASRRTAIRTHSAAGCIALDFNNDGHVDLAIANHKEYGDHRGHSFVYRSTASGLDLDHPVRLPTSGPHGMFAAHPGNQADRGDEEYYVSAPHRMPDGRRIGSIAWDAELPPRTWVTAQFRTAATQAGLDAAAWQSDGDRGWPAGPVRVHGGPWVQYRLALGAYNSGNTPRVREVRVEWVPG
jgi:hypothetical protein